MKFTTILPIVLFPTSISGAEFGRVTLEEKEKNARNLRTRSLELSNLGDFSMPEIEASMSLSPSTIPAPKEVVDTATNEPYKDLIPAAITLSRYSPTNAPVVSSGPTIADDTESSPTDVPTGTDADSTTANDGSSATLPNTPIVLTAEDVTESNSSPTYAPSISDDTASSPTYVPTSADVEASSSTNDGTPATLLNVPTVLPVEDVTESNSAPTYAPTIGDDTESSPTYVPTGADVEASSSANDGSAATLPNTPILLTAEDVTESNSSPTFASTIADDTESLPTYVPTSADVEASSSTNDGTPATLLNEPVFLQSSPTYVPTSADVDAVSTANDGSAATPTKVPTVLTVDHVTESNSSPTYAPTIAWPTHAPMSASGNNSSTTQMVENEIKPTASPSPFPSFTPVTASPTLIPEEEQGGFLSTVWGGIQNAWGFVSGKKEKN